MSTVMTLLTMILLAGVGFIASGYLVPRHVALDQAKRELRDKRKDNHFVAAMTKHCLHSSVPWPVMTSDGMLVAWLCDECMEERDTFKPPPRKAKPIQVDLLADPPWVEAHEHDWSEIRSLDAHIVHRVCRCGQNYKYVDTPDLVAEWLDIQRTAMTRRRNQ